MLRNPALPYLVECPRCSACAVIEDEPGSEVRLVCSGCAFVRSGSIDRFDAATGMIEPFGCRLWIRISFRGNILYAYSYEHLSHIRSYIGALHRTQPRPSSMTTMNRLPAWVKAAGNREKLLDAIDQQIRDRRPAV